jgi:hypothetical protein
MRRLLTGCLTLTLAAILLSGAARSARAADSPFAGTWKVTLMLPGQDIAIFLVEIKDADGKTEGKILSALDQLSKDAKVETIKTDGAQSLQITLSGGGGAFPLVLHAPKGEAKPDKLFGSVDFRGRQFARMERTDDKEIDSKKAIVNSTHREAFVKATGTPDAKEKLKALKEFLGTKDVEPALLLMAGIELLGSMAENDVGKDEAAKQAEETVKLAAVHGPEMKLLAQIKAAKALAGSEKLAPAAVDLARDAEKALDKNTPVSVQVSVLSTLKSALQKAGKAAEAKELTPKIAKLDDQLDQEFLKDAVPFKTGEIARAEKGDRVVLVELFTGAQCPPCVAADVAFDAMLKSYKLTDVVFLQYHLHIPGPDALTNEDSIKRMQYYVPDPKDQATPTFFIDGNKGPAVGGAKAAGKEAYETLNKALAEALEVGAQAKLKLSAVNKDGKIDIHAEASNLSKTGENVRLRFVLVEEMARYPGSNGQRIHHHVVRAFPGGVEGIALKEKSSKHDIRVNLNEVKKNLNDYLANFKGKKFDEDERPLDLKNLKIVAFIQRDDGDKDIYQAAQIDLSEAK